MSDGQEAPPTATTSSWITSLLQLLPSSSSGPLGHEEAERLKAQVISVVSPPGVVQHDDQAQMNGGVNLTFSRPPHDVTTYIKERPLYANDTTGAFSDIHKCVLKKPGESRIGVAVKAFRVAGGNGNDLRKREEKLKEEVYIWIRLDHPNILKLYGMASGFAPLPALVSPWIEKGTLTKYLGGPGQGISRGERISILVKVAEALHYIHSENVVHGDLTGSNILIDDDGQPLISDFGLSSILKEHNETSYFKSRKPGSIRWAAPELLAKLPESPMLVEHNAPIENTSTAEPSIESDIYSYGCVMLHTLSGKIPYSEILHDIYVPLYIKVHGNSPQRPIDPPIGEMHWQMITNCLDVTPENRQKLTEVIASLRREG